MDIAKMKKYYQRGLWKKAMVDKLLAVGKITEDEYIQFGFDLRNIVMAN